MIKKKKIVSFKSEISCELKWSKPSFSKKILVDLMSFTQMLFAADFCPPFDPGLKFSKKSKTSRPAEIHPVFIWAYKYGSDIENSWQNQKIFQSISR